MNCLGPGFTGGRVRPREGLWSIQDGRAVVGVGCLLLAAWAYSIAYNIFDAE
jgi:hypothetical protein